MSTEATQPRLAIVTGTSSGIGQAIAQRLLEQGWHVRGLDAAAPTLSHPAFDALRIDLTDATAIAAVAPSLTSAQALVHAAGVLRVGSLGQLDDEAGALMWQLHVRAASLLADSVVPAMMRRRDGRVVLIGSRVSQGMPGRSQYAASKAALVAMARSWAAEAIEHQVTVNVISPAATQTAMLGDPARAATTPRLPPIGRYIQPAEIAELTAYLLSPAAAAITGQDIAICGGASVSR